MNVSTMPDRNKKSASRFFSLILFLVSLLFVAQAVSNIGHRFDQKRADEKSVRADGSKQDPMDAVLIVDASGPNQILGKEIAAGFQDGLRENKSQDFIRMIIRDSRGAPEAAAALADGSAAGNRTLVMVGPTEAESASSLIQSAKEGEVTALLPIGTPRREAHSKWSFALQPPVYKQGQLLGKLLRRTVTGDRIARFIPVNSPPDGLWAGVIDSYTDKGVDGLELVTWEKDQSETAAKETISQNLYFDAVIISLPMSEAARVVRWMRLLGYTGLIVVEGEASISNFANQFNKEPKEILKPGYFTDGIISLAPFLPTIASENSQRLIMDYRARNQRDPSWAYAYGYDSGQLISDFVRRSRANNDFNLSNPDLLRSNFRAYLAGLQSDSNFLYGYTGQLKFGANNQRSQSPKLLIYKNKVQNPYFEQLSDEPTLNFGAEADSNAINIGEEKYILAPVVYTGVSLKTIEKIDFDNNVYDVVFDISLKAKQPIEITDIQFLNLVAEKRPPILLEDRSDRDSAFRRYRIAGTFSFNPAPADVILDRTTLNLSWRSRQRDANSLKFVIDPDYSEVDYQTVERGLNTGRETSAEGFSINANRLGVDNAVIAAPGDPRSIGGVIKFSTVTLQTDVSRQVSSLTSRLINDVGLERLQVIFMALSLLFSAFTLLTLFYRRAVFSIIWWIGFTLVCFFSEAAFFTSTEQIGLMSGSMVFVRYFFNFVFTIAIVRILDLLFTLRAVKRAQSSDVQPVINFLIRFGLYFSALGFYYTVILGRELLPILATFSVLLTVFGLALRELIFDAIAGVAIAADGNLATDQWVNIRAKDRNIHGVVQALGWRYVAIRSRDEQVHFVPNSVVATQILSNLSLGDGFSRVEIPFSMSAGSDIAHIIPKILNQIQVTLSHDASVSQRNPVKIVVGDLEDDRLRCIVQIYYAPSQSVDMLRTAVIRTVQSVLVEENAFSTMPLRLSGLRPSLAQS